MELETVAKRVENKDIYVRKNHYNSFSISKLLERKIETNYAKNISKMYSIHLYRCTLFDGLAIVI